MNFSSVTNTINAMYRQLSIKYFTTYVLSKRKILHVSSADLSYGTVIEFAFDA